MKSDLQIRKEKKIRRGKLLKEARIKAGFTRRELHTKLETTYGYLSALEDGKKGLTIDMLERIADIFGVQISDILKR